MQREHTTSISLSSSMLPLSLINPEFPRDLDPFVIIQKFTAALRYRTQGKECTEVLNVRPIARAVATMDPMLAEKLMANFCTRSCFSYAMALQSNCCAATVRPSLRQELKGISQIVFLPLAGGRRLVSLLEDGTLHIWDIERGETVIGPLEGHTDAVSCVAVHGSRIASCSWDGTFRVWDADNGKLVLGPFTAHDGEWLCGIAYSRDGTRIATAGGDNLAAIWDANTGVRLSEMVGHTDIVSCVAFSEDGTRLVSGSFDNTVRIWDVASGECIGEPFTGHTNWVCAVCFSPDAKRIFSLSSGDTIRLWDAETRTLIGEPLRMDAMVLCMALSPDCKRLVSGSVGGEIALWDSQTGAAIPVPFQGHKDWVRSVSFSPDGRKIASASDDKTIALWDATDDWKRWDIDDEDVEKDDD